jgi:hypothetical protein
MSIEIGPPTPERVPRHTSGAINERIRRRVEGSLAYYAERPHQIDARLRELDREWSVERQLEANAAALATAGAVLGAFVDRRILALPIAVGAFLLQHAVQGWCPPRAGVPPLGHTDTDGDRSRTLRAQSAAR